MARKQTIPVWTSDSQDNTKAALPTIARRASAVVEVETDLIAENLNAFMEKFRPVVESQDQKSPFVIDEVELSLAVNAKGGIELLGKLEAGAQAGIKIKLKRRTP
jgi:hypothetical protein